jgi:hypothetical protein
MSNINKVIKKLIKMYNKNNNYFNLYFVDVMVFILLIIFIIFMIGLFITLQHKQYLVENWEEERCKLNVMPFAGFINKPSNISFNDYSVSNFKYCNDKVLKGVSLNFLEPFTIIINAILSVFKLLENILELLNKFLLYLKTLIIAFFQLMYNLIMTILAEFIYVFLKLVGGLNAFTGIMKTIFNIIFTLYISIIALFKNTINATQSVIYILLGVLSFLLAMIALYAALVGIPFVGFAFLAPLTWAIITFALTLVTYLILTILLAIVVSFVKKLVE